MTNGKAERLTREIHKLYGGAPPSALRSDNPLWAVKHLLIEATRRGESPWFMKETPVF